MTIRQTRLAAQTQSVAETIADLRGSLYIAKAHGGELTVSSTAEQTPFPLPSRCPARPRSNVSTTPGRGDRSSTKYLLCILWPMALGLNLSVIRSRIDINHQPVSHILQSYTILVWEVAGLRID